MSTYLTGVVILIVVSVDYDRPDVFFLHVVLQGIVEDLVSDDFRDFIHPVAVDLDGASVKVCVPQTR